MENSTVSPGVDIAARPRIPSAIENRLRTQAAWDEASLDLHRRAADEIARLTKELETERMRLTACGVVAMSNTPESAVRARTMHPDYWCASVGDVACAVDREMELRRKLEASRPLGMTQASVDVLNERQRQIDVEGYDATHDDEHEAHELAQAAASYVRPEVAFWTMPDGYFLWPWTTDAFKPRSERENYVRAAALLLAAIERIDRAEATHG